MHQTIRIPKVKGRNQTPKEVVRKEDKRINPRNLVMIRMANIEANKKLDVVLENRRARIQIMLHKVNNITI